MSLLQELLSGLDQIDPAKAEQLRAELHSAGASPGEPAKPPTVLDNVRDGDYDDLLVTEVPNGNELPYVVAALVKAVYDLQHPDESQAKPADVTAPAPAPTPTGEPAAAGGPALPESDPALTTAAPESVPAEHVPEA